MEWGQASVSRYRLLRLWLQKYYDEQNYWIGYSSHSSPSPRFMIKQKELLGQILRVLNAPDS